MARWSSTSAGAQWLEWSVSVEGASPGQGMMEPAWRDVWYDGGSVAIFTTESSHVEGRMYKLCHILCYNGGRKNKGREDHDKTSLDGCVAWLL